MSTIPAAELQALVTRYGGPDLTLDADPSVSYVRSVASGNREAVQAWGEVPYNGTLLAEADDLDALADRYEQETET